MDFPNEFYLFPNRQLHNQDEDHQRYDVSKSYLSLQSLYNIHYLLKDILSNLFLNQNYKSWQDYLAKLPNDPWGSAYNYLIPGQNAEYDLYSLGADGVLGGEAANGDIGNWAIEWWIAVTAKAVSPCWN